MRALNGVVVLCCRKYIKIQLESGNTITTKPVKDVGNGSQVEVAFDFTKSRVKKVWIKGEQPDIPEPRESLGDDVYFPKINVLTGVFSTRVWGIEGWEDEEPEVFDEIEPYNCNEHWARSI